MKTKIKSRVMIALAAIILVGTISSCATIRGVGRDISHTGSHIEQAARY